MSIFSEIYFFNLSFTGNLQSFLNIPESFITISFLGYPKAGVSIFEISVLILVSSNNI